MRAIVVLSIVSFFFGSAVAQKKRAIDETQILTENVFSITEVLFHDVVNPPAAARFYSYSLLTAENISGLVNESPKLKESLRDGYWYTNTPESKINNNFSSIYGMLETARHIIPSGYSLEDKQARLYTLYQDAGFEKAVLDSSISFAKKVAQHHIKIAKADGYFDLSVKPKYNPMNVDSTWYPTPPEYMGAVEPHWSTIKPFFLESSKQFAPAPPVKFNSESGSEFYALMKEVRDVTSNLSEEQTLIAKYWDCNPFANFYSGHVNVAIKKISPGGHWMSITGIACKKAKLSFEQSVYIHAVIAMALHDAFISCWDEKYRSHRIRPKTAINRYIDERWDPILETPPFPEYTSGHSVVSAASSTLLTFLIGDQFEFVDTTEIIFGLPSRKFRSFKAASDEAAISRLYGGIHYRDAIANGVQQGEQIGRYIISKLQTSHSNVNR